MKLLRNAIVIALCALASACFHWNGAHVVNPYGTTDRGWYSMRMSEVAYEYMQSSDDGRRILRQMRSFSNPNIRYSGGDVYIEDRSGNVRSESLYDSVNCVPAGGGYVDCTYVIRTRSTDMPDWSFRWEAQLQPGMRVVRSNHHASHVENGSTHLVWSFASPNHSYIDVNFTIRTW